MDSIRLTYKDKVYQLEFTRKSVQTMESRGFVLENLSKTPVTLYYELFKGAFLAHHKFLSSSLIDDIYEATTSKAKLHERLLDMYTSTLTSLLGDGEDEEGENSENFTPNWE